jgi:UDP-N-acetyl-D-mannosaminuronic acid dehydrogenase
MHNVKKVVMMGLGYIGLPTAALIASKGIKVHGVDVNPDIVKTINNSKVHIVEPDLEGLVTYVVEKGLFRAHTRPSEADVFLIAVPTPLKNGIEPDISFVESAIRMIIPYLREDNVVILESTSPVGTTEKMADLIFSNRHELKSKIHIAYCPERVLPGKILFELECNDRAIGGLDEKSSAKAKDFYELFVKGILHTTNARTAEMCKLTENAFRDVNIAFANEISIICDQLNINAWELIALANLHPRVNILQPGPGVGGHCIAVDPWFIVSSAPNDAHLIKTARKVNDDKPLRVVEKILSLSKQFKHPVIACLGLAFKANVDDLRESPALTIVKKLVEKQVGQILAVEPNIKKLPRELAAHTALQLVDLETALHEADVIALLTDHKEFNDIDSLRLKGKLVIDTRGLWSHQNQKR